MKEDEAKTKWCPMVRFDNGPEGLGVNRDIEESKNPQEKTYCLASECMWWVWDDETHIPPNQRTNGGHCGAIGREL